MNFRKLKYDNYQQANDKRKAFPCIFNIDIFGYWVFNKARIINF